MRLFLTAVVTGTAIGCLYGLVALGYTVVFNATRVFNLAQGILVMSGVMACYVTLDVFHWPQAAAFGGAVGTSIVLSLLEERVVVRQFLRREGEGIGWFIATLAFSLVIETIIRNLYGDRAPAAVPSFLPVRSIAVGPISIAPRLFFVIASTAVIVVMLEIFYRRTWVGTAMRATAEDPEAASLRGIEPTRISSTAFMLGGVVAGIGAFAIAPVAGSNISLGLTYSLAGFIALAVGGFGSLRGAIAGGILLGIGNQLWDLYVDPRYELVAGLALLMLVLVVKPTGILGSRQLRRV